MKKILITILLSVSITTSVIVCKQRQAEAFNPVTTFVELTKATVLTGYIGAYIAVRQISNLIDVFRIDSVNTNTGDVVLDNDNNIYGNQNNEQVHETYNGKLIFPSYMLIGGEPSGATWIRTEFMTGHNTTTQGFTNIKNLFANDTRIDFCVMTIFPDGDSMIKGYSSDGVNQTDPPWIDTVLGSDGLYQAAAVQGGQGEVYTGTIDDFPIEFYTSFGDVPGNCFDGIQNQDEAGIDCGGVCLTNFGFDCTPPETCFDGIMNQDETGIDYGGVCGGEPVPPAVFTDANQDNIDDIAGVHSDGTVPVGLPGNATAGTYDTSLPGTVSEIGDTDWKTLIMNYLSTSPLVQLATGATINLSGADCSLNATVFGHNVVINFCDLQWMVDLLGTFVLAIFTLRSLFIALGVD